MADVIFVNSDVSQRTLYNSQLEKNVPAAARLRLIADDGTVLCKDILFTGRGSGPSLREGLWTTIPAGGAIGRRHIFHAGNRIGARPPLRAYKAQVELLDRAESISPFIEKSSDALVEWRHSFPGRVLRRSAPVSLLPIRKANKPLKHSAL